MNLYEQILKIYPNLSEQDFLPNVGSILIQDDSNGKGQYIAKWENNLPCPTEQQLNSNI